MCHLQNAGVSSVTVLNGENFRKKLGLQAPSLLMRLKTRRMRPQTTVDWVALPLSATGGQSIHSFFLFRALAHEDTAKKMFTPETGP